jgi:hypothetical protein
MKLGDAYQPEHLTVPFGKHKGKTLLWIAQNDASYLDRLLGYNLTDPLKSAVEKMCQTWSKEIDQSIESKPVNSYSGEREDEY